MLKKKKGRKKSIYIYILRERGFTKNRMGSEKKKSVFRRKNTIDNSSDLYQGRQGEGKKKSLFSVSFSCLKTSQ